jgi:hypothetical protein
MSEERPGGVRLLVRASARNDIGAPIGSRHRRLPWKRGACTGSRRLSEIVLNGLLAVAAIGSAAFAIAGLRSRTKMAQEHAALAQAGGGLDERVVAARFRTRRPRCPGSSRR